MSGSTIILNADAVHRAMNRIAHEIVERNPDTHNLVLVAIQCGGVHFANRLATLLHEILKHPIPVGVVDVSMHRDDLEQRPNPQVHPTAIPFDLNEKIVVLVDDVLFSGRTTRAALDALNDLGRPKAIQLAVLIDRGHRELPIRATFVGKNVPTALTERITVRWKEEGSEDLVYLEKP